MHKQGALFFLRIMAMGLLIIFLPGCLTSAWTGATLLYDRHNLYKKLSDYQLDGRVRQVLFKSKDESLKCKDCHIESAVFNGDVLLVGWLPTVALRDEAERRVREVPGYRRFFNQIAIHNDRRDSLEDQWITTKICGEIVADSAINPHDFKIVTSEQIVYLMGDVIPQQAERVIQKARQCYGVKRVVKLFKYYNLSDQPT